MARPASNFFRDAYRSDRARPLVLAHRGDSFYAPENTVEAAIRGKSAGADAWELDVRLSADAIPVVVHDDTLIRTTDVSVRFRDDPRRARGYRVDEFTLDELRRLDAGSWFLQTPGARRSAEDFGTLERIARADRAAFESGRIRIPTLAEALELTRDLDWAVNVELKSRFDGAPRLVEAVLQEIDRTGVGSRVTISSFDHLDVARVARSRPEIPTGVLIANPLCEPVRYVREIVGADALHASAEALGIGPTTSIESPVRLVDFEAAAEAALPILVYTVNDARPEGSAARLALAGVAGVFTDDPAGLIRLFRSEP